MTAPYRLQRPVPHPIRDERHNLPTSLSSFIGRERELVEVQARLTGARLVTLTGVGGCGKTRLALEVAWAVLDRYPDGVWLVELAALADAALVPQTVAAVFGMRETPDVPIATALASGLQGRSLLLVMDNCEHLLDACARLADALLRACTGLRVLVTSREALGITGEIAWRVPSLAVPDAQQLPPLTELGHNPAVRLFVERAAAVEPGFVLSERNAAVVALVCQRLDGIPLALELAAARIQALTVEQLSARLDERFRLLTSGSRTALPRQKTLRATLDWSYDLLSEAEQLLFNRLSVFAGGWSLEAAEVVCSGKGIEQQDVLDLLQHLVSKSLVVAKDTGDGAQRYALPETLRQYANEGLLAAPDREAVYRRHASYYLDLAEVAEPRTRDAAWLDRLMIEHDNLRAAMRWLIERNAVEEAVRLGGVLYPVWVTGGYLMEGRTQLRTLVTLPGAARTSPAWGRLLCCAAFVEYFAGDYAAARKLLEHVVTMRGTIDDRVMARALSDLGQVAREQEDYASARMWLAESVQLFDAIGDRQGKVRALVRTATVTQALGDYDVARRQYRECLDLARQADSRVELAWSLHNRGCLALDEADYPAARDYLAQSVKSRLSYDSIGLVHALAMFACLAAAEGLPAAAVRLAGATAAFIQKTGIPVQHSQRKRYERWLATAQQALGEDAAAAAWNEGRKMRLDQALAYALAPSEPVARAGNAIAHLKLAHTSDKLTLREREVAALVAQGRSNRQIAEALVITERTVASHVEHILDKLSFTSRTQIGVWAVEHGLVGSNTA